MLGSTLNWRRQILTANVSPRAERVIEYSVIIGLFTNKKSSLREVKTVGQTDQVKRSDGMKITLRKNNTTITIMFYREPQFQVHNNCLAFTPERMSIWVLSL